MRVTMHVIVTCYHGRDFHLRMHKKPFVPGLAGEAGEFLAGCGVGRGPSRRGRKQRGEGRKEGKERS